MPCRLATRIPVEQSWTGRSTGKSIERDQSFPTLEAESLGTDGTLDRDGDDLFRAPGAMDPELTEIWQGARRKVPGVLIQAVLTQSLNLQHWLTPASQALTTALASGFGFLIAAAQTSRRRRLLMLGVVSFSHSVVLAHSCHSPMAHTPSPSVGSTFFNSTSSN